jgi:alpha-ketoglutaric semialdehyde dehydrogenase
MKPALLLVDLQRDYLSSPGIQPPTEALVARAAALLQGCRRRCVPVIHIRTTLHREDDRRLPHWKRADRWLCVAGSEGHQPPAALQPQAGEIVIHKSGFNGFADPNLDAALRRMHCDAVILAGVHLHTCVRAAAAESLERGLEVFVAEDATGSNDPLHAAAGRRWLAERCVRFESVAAVLSGLDGASSSSLVHRSPSDTARILFEVPVAGADAVAAAATAARDAQEAWQESPISSRQALLEGFARRLDDAAPELVRQMAIEIGKPLSHGLEEVRRAAGNIRDVIRRAASFEPRSREAAGIVRHRSAGVVAIVSPWNNPVAIPAGKIAPALAYGNTVVWKPAPAATRISQAILELLRSVGAPIAAVRLLTGDHTTAQRLAADERVDAVTFTGSAAGGYAMQEICARRFVPLQAELSGNNAAILWDDADFARAAMQIARGAFGFAGQRCTANRRVVVSRARYETALRELALAAEKLRWGDPSETATDLGPVIDAAKRDEHAARVRAAEDSGAAHRVVRLFEGKAHESWVQAGAFARPAIVCCDRPEHSLVQEETMGPLLVVQRAEDFDHALQLCNGVRHGLVAALFSCAPDLQRAFLAGARAGVLKLNSATAGVAASLPFGGWKSSGIGPPEHGEGDRLFYTRMQSVYGAGDDGVEPA